MKLNQAAINRRYRILQTPENLLLRNLGIVASQTCRLKYKYPLSGPVVIRLYNRDVALGNHIARQIEVREIAGFDS